MKITALIFGFGSMLTWGSSVQANLSQLDRLIEVPPVAREDLPSRRPFVPSCDDRPELIISTIVEPAWDARARGTIIPVVVKNKGRVVAENFRVQLRDGSTIRTAFITAVAPGSSYSVYFTLPYWVYNPDADFTVHVDSTNRVRECSETNNVKEFFGPG
jgi:hypothetical protein